MRMSTNIGSKIAEVCVESAFFITLLGERRKFVIAGVLI